MLQQAKPVSLQRFEFDREAPQGSISVKKKKKNPHTRRSSM